MYGRRRVFLDHALRIYVPVNMNFLPRTGRIGAGVCRSTQIHIARGVPPIKRQKADNQSTPMTKAPKLRQRPTFSQNPGCGRDDETPAACSVLPKKRKALSFRVTTALTSERPGLKVTRNLEPRGQIAPNCPSPPAADVFLKEAVPESG